MDKSKMWFWILLDVLIAFAAVNLIFFVMPMLSGLKASFAPARTITVSAQGMATASPDMATIMFSVVTQGQSPKVLSDNNNTKMNAVTQFVSSQGIASSDVATTAYDLQPNYQWDKITSRSFINGYTLTQTVTVKIRDLNKVASVLAGLAPLGVNQIGGVNFTFQDPNKFIALARADALTKAHQQANEMAAQAGTAIGIVVNINESSYFPMAKSYAYGMGGSSADMAAPVVPPISPGAQDVTDSVTITYALQ